MPTPSQYFFAFSFIDGAYLRERSKRLNLPFVNPKKLSQKAVQEHAIDYPDKSVLLRQVLYYDAVDADETLSSDLTEYFEKIEALPDTHLRFGFLRGRSKKKPRRQKGVDVQLAVDLLVGAFEKQFERIFIITADSDFIPVLEEVKRKAIKTVLVSDPQYCPSDLKNSCDRFVPLPDEWLKECRMK